MRRVVRGGQTNTCRATHESQHAICRSSKRLNSELKSVLISLTELPKRASFNALRPPQYPDCTYDGGHGRDDCGRLSQWIL